MIANGIKAAVDAHLLKHRFVIVANCAKVNLHSPLALLIHFGECDKNCAIPRLLFVFCQGLVLQTALEKRGQSGFIQRVVNDFQRTVIGYAAPYSVEKIDT